MPSEQDEISQYLIVTVGTPNKDYTIVAPQLMTADLLIDADCR